MDNMAIHVQGIRVRSASEDEGSHLAARKGSDPVVNSDRVAITEHTVVLRNSPEGTGAEVERKLLWEYEPGIGIRCGAMLPALLK